MPRFSYPRRVPGWAPIIMTVAAAWVVQSAMSKWKYEIAYLFGDIFPWARDQFLLHGVSRPISVRCATYLSYSPFVFLNFLLGAILGYIAAHQWRRFADLFVISLALLPYVLYPEIYQYGWKKLGYETLLQIICMVPAVFLGAWLFSQPRKRRRERRRSAGLCEVCGYSLAGNTSGICPECGATISKGMYDADKSDAI